jgi:glucose/arabinose dehydrogenase
MPLLVKRYPRTVILSLFLLAILAFSACVGAPAPTSALPTSTQTAAAATDMPATAAASPVLSTSTLPPLAPPSTSTPVTYTWTLVVDGLTKPNGIANAGDGSGRLFVLEQPGTVRIIQGGLLLADPFLDIHSQVGSQGSEQGLLGIVFDPAYSQTGYFYVNYTNKGGNTVIARFKVSSNPNLADPASEVHILDVQQPYPNHNGGQLAFGPDGFLYIGLGDGGSQGDPHGNGQSVQTLLGKLLRIDVHQGSPYAIPAGNPFVDGGGRPEIWAYGLRNPWRFYFDPLTHGLYIADVGQNLWEEIDYVPPNYTGPAINFGWNCREGLHVYKDCTAPAGSAFGDPVWEYNHSAGGCAIISGLVYHGKALPGMDGVYLFGDYCSGLVWGLTNTNGQNWNANQLFQTHFLITAFGLDEAGEAYLVDQHGGIYRLSQ